MRIGVLLLGFLFLLSVGCGGGRSEERSLVFLQTPPPAVEWTYVPDSTATPWPTFTPVPTPTLMPTPWPTVTPTLVPTATPVPERTRVANSAGGVSPVLPDDGVVQASPMLVPTPTPYGWLGAGRMRFDRQVLLPLQVLELPDYIASPDWSRLPSPARVISRTTKMAFWLVIFDPSGLEREYTEMGYVRWMDVTPGLEPLVMFEKEVELTFDIPYFFVALGDRKPGFWKPGVYRVEFLTDVYELVVDWEFEVR